MAEEKLLSYIHNLPDNQPGVALDIGANIGHYTGLMALKFEHVYAFEPNPANMTQLQNNVTQPNVTFVPEAVGKVDNVMVELYLCDAPGMHTINRDTAGMLKWGHTLDRFILVPSVTLNRVAAKIPNIRLIKCDIESCEDFVFQHGEELLKNNKLTILLEVHQNVNLDRLYNIFYNCGYKVYDDNKVLVQYLQADYHYIITNEDLK